MYMTYMKNTHTKQLLYYQRVPFSWLELHVSQNRQFMAPNTYMYYSLFPIHHFVRTYIHHSKTKGRIRMF